MVGTTKVKRGDVPIVHVVVVSQKLTQRRLPLDRSLDASISPTPDKDSIRTLCDEKFVSDVYMVAIDYQSQLMILRLLLLLLVLLLAIYTALCRTRARARP